MKLLDKIKKLPPPVMFIGLMLLLWAYPFIEAGINGAQGFSDLTIFSTILIILGMIPFAYMFIKYFIIAIGGWCLWKLGIIKNKK